MNIKLKDYQKLALIENPSEQQKVSCLLGITVKELMDMPESQVQERGEDIARVLQGDNELVRLFKIGGITYGFIPNLDEITYGENKDLTSYISDWENMHKAMAVAYRPVLTNRKGKPIINKKGQYEIAKYEGTGDSAEAMKELPIGIVLGMQVFFYNLMNSLLNYIPSYLKEEVEKATSSLRNGEVTKNSIHLHKEI